MITAATEPTESTVQAPAWARRLRRRFMGNTLIAAGAAVIVVVLFVAAAAPLLSPYDPIKSNLRERLRAPSLSHPAGTDAFGRDALTRIAYGARVSVHIAVVIVALTTLIGSVLGLLAGWFRRLDNPLMRVMDVLMSIPSLILAIALIGFLGARQENLIAAIVVTQVPRMTRIVRSAVIAIRASDYVETARATGCTDARIMVRHIYPHCLPPIAVQATFLFAQAILIEAALSFIGVGTMPPTPSWGNMLAEGREHISVAWWLTVLPGVSIMIVVLGLNLLGDGLRDLLDPRLRNQE